MPEEKKNNTGWLVLLVILVFLYLTNNDSSTNTSYEGVASTQVVNETITATPTSVPLLPKAMPVYDSSPDYFYGYECTDDCSGHEAGYNWAEENGITEIDDCGGNSNSFIEGCEAYAQEYSEEYVDYEGDYY